MPASPSQAGTRSQRHVGGALQVAAQAGRGAWQWVRRRTPEEDVTVGAAQWDTQCTGSHTVSQGAQGRDVQRGQYSVHLGFSHFTSHGAAGSRRSQAAVGCSVQWQVGAAQSQRQSVGSAGLHTCVHTGSSHASAHCWGGAVHA
jgi:hypothetical protein